MHSYWIEDLTARIVDAQKQGLAGGLDPELAGEALGWMAERLVTQSLDRDPHQVLDTIIAIMAKCIFSGPLPVPASESEGDGSETSGSRPARRTRKGRQTDDAGAEQPDAKPPSGRRADGERRGTGSASRQD
jgi:hypothetical protein